MRVADVASYLARVPCYSELSDAFLGLKPGELADWIIAQLQRADAVHIESGIVSPTMAA